MLSKVEALRKKLYPPGWQKKWFVEKRQHTVFAGETTRLRKRARRAAKRLKRDMEEGCTERELCLLRAYVACLEEEVLMWSEKHGYSRLSQNKK
jgi:hypothetical protein